MSEIYIAKEKLPGALSQSMEKFRVIGPVFTGQFHELQKWQNLKRWISHTRTRGSPRKGSSILRLKGCSNIPSPRRTRMPAF